VIRKKNLKFKIKEIFMKTQNYLVFALVVIAVGVGSFYGGMLYAGKKSNSSSLSGGGNFQNLTQEQRQQMRTNGGAGQYSARSRNGSNGGGFVSGEIIKKDSNSVTVKLPDGGSKIIFFSDTTKVSKMADGTINDVVVGKSIIANGKTNQDGSISADTIQFRPNMLQGGQDQAGQPATQEKK
jgi:hypothetical protein